MTEGYLCVYMKIPINTIFFMKRALALVPMLAALNCGGARPATQVPTSQSQGVIHDQLNAGMEFGAQPTVDEKEQHAALRAEDERLTRDINNLRSQRNYKLSVCMHENWGLINHSFELLGKRVTDEELNSCAPPKQQPLEDCIDELFLHQGSIHELIEYWQATVESEREIMDCTKDDTRWDPIIGDMDFEGGLVVNHPDPEIRGRIQNYLKLSEKGRKYLELLKRNNRKKADDKRKICWNTPEYSQCGEKKEELQQAFREKPNKQNYLNHLDQMVACQIIFNKCVEK